MKKLLMINDCLILKDAIFIDITCFLTSSFGLFSFESFGSLTLHLHYPFGQSDDEVLANQIPLALILLQSIQFI